MKYFLIFLLLLTSSISFSSNDKVFSVSKIENISSILNSSDSNKNINKTKVIAVTLAVTLGVFGVHRLYLGTKPLIPIAYTLTLGGGMAILPIIDIFYIISCKDINQITDNEYMFMWNKGKSTNK